LKIIEKISTLHVHLTDSPTRTSWGKNNTPEKIKNVRTFPLTELKLKYIFCFSETKPPQAWENARNHRVQAMDRESDTPPGFC